MWTLSASALGAVRAPTAHQWHLKCLYLREALGKAESMNAIIQHLPQCVDIKKFVGSNKFGRY